MASTTIRPPSYKTVPTDRDRASREMLQRAQDAEPAERDRLMDEVARLNIDFAQAVAMRYRRRGIPDEDLAQIGCLGLVKACHGFDPAKCRGFLGYAVPTIRGEVRRHFRDKAWMVRPPRRIQETQAQIRSTTEKFSQQHGRDPTDQELAERLEVTAHDVADAKNADGCYAPPSLDQPGGEHDDLNAYDLLGAEDSEYERSEAVVALQPLCQNLAPRERHILYRRFFDSWTQQRIADEIGITQMQVSRLLSRLLARLREELTADPSSHGGPHRHVAD